MNLISSGQIKNNVKIRSIIIAVILHIYIAAITFGLSLLLLLAAGLISSYLINKEVEEAESSSNKFRKNFPFKYFGEVFGEFQHVFYHSTILEKSMYDAIESALKTKTPVKSLSQIVLTDVDKDLSRSEDRTFIKTDSTETDRGTSVTLILNQSQYGSMQSIQWRVLAGGYVDHDKKFNLIAYSFLTIWFWIIPYIKREHDLLRRVRTIYPGAYNDMDVITQIRCLHESVFDAMINELESNGIDTSDLKAQRMQVMNINISGGKVNMGNVVQGAINRVSNVARGARK